MPRGFDKLGSSLTQIIEKNQGVGEREIRKALSQKQNKLRVGAGFPMRASGSGADMTMNDTPDGIRLYIKFSGRWYGFRPDFIENESYKEQQGSAIVASYPSESHLPILAAIGELAYVSATTKMYIYSPEGWRKSAALATV